MNRVFLQLWEEAFLNKEPIEDGCSIHLSEHELNMFIDKIYNSRVGTVVPEIYERVVGPHMQAFIEDDLYEQLKNKKSLRLSQIEFNNLVNFEELLLKL